MRWIWIWQGTQSLILRHQDTPQHRRRHHQGALHHRDIQDTLLHHHHQGHRIKGTRGISMKGTLHHPHHHSNTSNTSNTSTKINLVLPPFYQDGMCSLSLSRVSVMFVSFGDHVWLWIIFAGDIVPSQWGLIWIRHRSWIVSLSFYFFLEIKVSSFLCSYSEIVSIWHELDASELS